jgi:hypothetical protein
MVGRVVESFYALIPQNSLCVLNLNKTRHRGTATQWHRKQFFEI